jgi:NAD(P)-dependent dehydrogenase (short-subunit alcohol dehydrogenase family)
MIFDFSNKTVLITGAARGIGFTIAENFCKFGAHVVIADINKQKGNESVQKLIKRGYKCSFKFLDLNDFDVFDVIIDDLINEFNQIDILINNARAGGKNTLLDENFKNWDQTSNVILKSSFFLSQLLIKNREKSKINTILNISSVAGILATPESPSYHASKGALISLTKYLAIEAGKYGVRVNCLLPGFIVQNEHLNRYNDDNNLNFRKISETYQPLGKPGNEIDVAESAMFLCSSTSKYINGVTFILDGGATSQEQFGLSHKISKIQ